MSGRRVGWILAIGFAAVAALAAIPIKSAFNTVLGDGIGFLPAIAAVVLSVWIGGFVPGLVATGLSMVLEAYVFMAPLNQLDVTLPSDRVRLVLFGMVGFLISWVAWLRGRAEDNAHRSRQEVERAMARVDLTMRRLSALQGLATELSGAVTRDEITDALMTHGIASLRADGAAVFLLTPGGDELEAIAWRGYGLARAEALARLPLDLSTPATDVARIGNPIYLADPADYVARYGASLGAHGVALEPRAVAAVPLDQEGQRFGVLGFSWNHAHDFPADRRAFIAAIAKAGAGALERARLADREHRRAAEARGGRRRDRRGHHRDGGRRLGELGERGRDPHPGGPGRLHGRPAGPVPGSGRRRASRAARRPGGVPAARPPERVGRSDRLSGQRVARRRGPLDGRGLPRRDGLPPGSTAAGGVPQPPLPRAADARDDDLRRLRAF